MKCLARFNGRFTGVLCPCSSWSLQQSLSFPCSAALPCQLGSTGCWFWRRLLSRTIAFDSALPWCCSGKAHWLSPSSLPGRRAVAVSSSVPCLSGGVWGLPLLQGREMASCTWPLCPAWGWPEVPLTGKPWLPCTAHGAVLGSAHITALTSGFDVGNGSACPLCVLAWPFWHYHLVFSTAVSLFCVLLRGCWEEDKGKHKCNAKKKKISLYDRIQIKIIVKCFSAIHTWNSFSLALKEFPLFPRIPYSEL